MHPPSWHYAEADRLLSEVKTIAPPFVSQHLRRAEIHALLAQYPHTDKDNQQ